MNDKVQQRLKNRIEILPNTIYSICEMADALNICEVTARSLITKGLIKSKRVGKGRGNHRIFGKWIIEYLTEECKKKHHIL